MLIEEEVEEELLVQMVNDFKTRPFTDLFKGWPPLYIVHGGVGFFYRHTLGRELFALCCTFVPAILHNCHCLQMSAQKVVVPCHISSNDHSCILANPLT